MNHTPTLEWDTGDPIGTVLLHCVKESRINLHVENVNLAVLSKGYCVCVCVCETNLTFAPSTNYRLL